MIGGNSDGIFKRLMHAVGRPDLAEDPALAFVLFDWDREGIQAFMKDPDAAEVMREAGLVAPPAFTYLEEAGDLPS